MSSEWGEKAELLLRMDRHSKATFSVGSWQLLDWVETSCFGFLHDCRTSVQAFNQVGHLRETLHVHGRVDTKKGPTCDILMTAAPRIPLQKKLSSTGGKQNFVASINLLFPSCSYSLSLLFIRLERTSSWNRTFSSLMKFSFRIHLSFCCLH
jgi:hypothetical protein